MKNHLSIIFICGFISAIHGLVYKDPELGAIVIDDDAVLDPELFDPADSELTTILPAGQCKTSSGTFGRCTVPGACYPYAEYLVGDDQEKDYTLALKEIFNTTEPCSEETEKDLICCPDYSYGLPNKRPSILPQFTRPPPTTTAATTTTTTSSSNGTETSENTETKASCGSSKIFNEATNPKVVGGRQAQPGEFPWAVALLDNGRQFCGGSLIDNEWVLTAAHCVQKLTQTQGIRIYIGDHDLSTASDTRHESRSPAKILYNAGFSFSNLRDDIALIKLSSPVSFTNSIQPICLNTQSIPYDKKADLAGWGKTGSRGYPSSTLRTVKMRVIPQKECQAVYQGSGAPPLTSGMICAGEKSALKDACNGDSGGPLTYTEGGPARQIGVVSWGIGCGEKPGVYTSVKEYLPWINRVKK